MLQTLIHLIYRQKIFTTVKAEVGKLDVNRLSNIPNSLNNLETRADYLDVGKLKTVSVDLEKQNPEH